MRYTKKNSLIRRFYEPVYNPPPIKHHKILCVAILSALACISLPTLAIQYQGPLDASGSSDQFNSIVTGDSTNGYVYHFQDGDEIIGDSTSKHYVVGGQWGSDLTISGDVSILFSTSTDARILTLDGLYVWVGSEDSFYTLKTDDVSISVELEGTLTSGNQWVYANGIYNTWGETNTGAVDILTHSVGNNAYVATAQGLITNNGGTISISGGTIQATAENDGYASQAFGISAEGHPVRENSISSSETVDITVHAINTSSDPSSFAAAHGVRNVQDDSGPLNIVTQAGTIIRAKAETNKGTAEAIGIYSGELAQTIIGKGDIEATAISEEGAGTAFGLYADKGTKQLFKDEGDITVKGSSLVAGVYADDGEIQYGGGTISATMSSEDIEPNAAGIYASANALVMLSGNSDIEAASALVGSGTVIVNKSISAGFNGAFNQFNGNLISQGISGLGMDLQTASSYCSENDEAALILYAGSKLEGHYSVGTQATSSTSTSNSSLVLLSDGTLVIVAAGEYDGSSPLVTVEEASAEEGAIVRVINTARIQDGTKVFELIDESLAPSNYLFETDSLFATIKDNKIVKKSALSVFDPEMLIPHVVDESLNMSGLGADRVIDLTSDSMGVTEAAQALNQIALMGVAGGAQFAAMNASQMIDDTIVEHGSLLAVTLHTAPCLDLWVNLNGTFNKADHYSVGNTSYGVKSDLAGVTVGADYAFGNGISAGGALSVGTGSVRGQGSGANIKNNVDYWGLSLYGVWTTPYLNLLASLGYVSSSNEIKQMGFKGKPDAQSLSLGLRVEKNIAINDTFTMTPHMGVRWVNIDVDSFNAGGFSYQSDRIDLFQIPIGVAFSNAFETDLGFKVKPVVDLEVTTNFGDTGTDSRVQLTGGSAEDVFETQINSDVIYSGKLSFGISKGNHDLNLSYKGSVGSQDRNDQRLQAVYRFRF